MELLLRLAVIHATKQPLVGGRGAVRWQFSEARFFQILWYKNCQLDQRIFFRKGWINSLENSQPQEGIPVNILTNAISLFQELAPEDREILLQMIATNFRISMPVVVSRSGPFSNSTPISHMEDSVGSFSEDRSMSAKEFMLQKQPRTDVERVATLAYYLTHYRSTPHFKTLDISKMNTEAAQPKFSNAAKAVDNAARNGYLVQATKGNKQLSAPGEQFVQALPDRDAAKSAMSKMRQRRKSRKSAEKRETNT